jgi:hypothetical protein
VCGRVSAVAECAELHRGSLNVRRQPPSATGSGTCEVRAVFFFSFVGENTLFIQKIHTHNLSMNLRVSLSSLVTSYFTQLESGD